MSIALALGYRVGHEGQIGGPQGRFFERIRRACADWDGSDPIRLVR